MFGIDLPGPAGAPSGTTLAIVSCFLNYTQGVKKTCGQLGENYPEVGLATDKSEVGYLVVS
jgi:hypothetical protein